MISQSELHYNILKECVENKIQNKSDLASKLGISEADISISALTELQFIKCSDNLVELLPQGYAAYLAISSQKRSSKQARKAIKFASWALGISIVSFIVSTIFSILSYLKCS
jgi:hypothetical protein